MITEQQQLNAALAQRQRFIIAAVLTYAQSNIDELNEALETAPGYISIGGFKFVSGTLDRDEVVALKETMLNSL